MQFLMKELIFLVDEAPPRTMTRTIFNGRRQGVFPKERFGYQIGLFRPIVLMRQANFPINGVPRVDGLTFKRECQRKQLRAFRYLAEVTNATYFRRLLRSSATRVNGREEKGRPIFERASRRLQYLREHVPRLK